jgi:hypothetical protein
MERERCVEHLRMEDDDSEGMSSSPEAEKGLWQHGNIERYHYIKNKLDGFLVKKAA